jgi:hypothetical protein
VRVDILVGIVGVAVLEAETGVMIPERIIARPAAALGLAWCDTFVHNRQQRSHDE